MNLDNYAPVSDRIAAFWRDNPDGRIATRLLVDDGTRVLFKAEVYRSAEDAYPMAEGYAEEIRGSSNVNKTSAIENGETSAIGRALANWRYQASAERPSREEMSKVEHFEQAFGTKTAPNTMSPRSAAEPPTQKQLNMLRALGSTQKPATKGEASKLIDDLRRLTPEAEEPF